MAVIKVSSGSNAGKYKSTTAGTYHSTQGAALAAERKAAAAPKASTSSSSASTTPTKKPTSSTTSKTSTNSAPSVNTPQDKSVQEGDELYLIGGGYYQGKPGRLTAVTDQNVLRALQAGTVKANSGTTDLFYASLNPTTPTTPKTTSTNTPTNTSTTPNANQPLTAESIAAAVSGAMGKNAPVSQGNETTQNPNQEQAPTEQGGVLPALGGGVGGGSVGGGTQVSTVTPLSNPSVVDFLNASGRPSDFTSRAALAKSLGINDYTGSAAQNQQLLSALRGSPVTAAEQVTPDSAGAVTVNSQVTPTTPANEVTLESLRSKLNFTPTQADFMQDPISSIKDITKQVFSSMGLDQANTEITKISNDLEKMENKRDAEIREANDNPWLTEGVRIRQVQKIEQKYADEINNRVNKLQLLESVRDDARQQAQFALGTAISIYDSQRQFQAQQIQMYYQQAEKEYDRQVQLYQLQQAEKEANKPDLPNSVQEWLFAVENGETRTYGEWANPTKSTSTSGGSGLGLITGSITDAYGKPLKLTATQLDTIAGYTNTVSSAQNALNLLSSGVQTGPVAGRLLQGAKLIGKADSGQLQLEQTLGKLKADFMKSLSGAAVSDQEVVRLSKFLPDITDQESVIESKLNSLISEINRSKQNYLGTLGGQETQPANNMGGLMSISGKTSSGLGYTIIN